jgi:hypothetical protein
MSRLGTIFVANDPWKACFLPARRLELKPRVTRHVSSTLTTDDVARVTMRLLPRSLGSELGRI